MLCRTCRLPTAAVHHLDHGAKPKLGNAEALSVERRKIEELRACTQSDKVSGLLTELQPGANRTDVGDAIAVLFDLFGQERLMWGSDWPILTHVGEHLRWFEPVQHEFAGICSHALNSEMGENALRIYRRRLR